MLHKHKVCLARPRQTSSYIEGVDLSKKMLDKAKQKNVYDDLIKEDILTYLTSL